MPCGDCNGCCKSSYFIHVGPDEAEALASIPRELLFEAPGLPKGHLILGYDRDGCCPMLVAEKCSIYHDRPATCRLYDCRVFAAAGIDPDKPSVSQRASRWRFGCLGERDRREFDRVQTAGRLLHEHAECFPPGSLPTNPVQLAVMAIKSYTVFSEPVRAPGAAQAEDAKEAIAAAMLQATEEF